ncbi:hypothetical protein GWI33_012283 [Rhynchophorus ferrugineus]|uniref:Tubulin glycylase 3A-like n=1 Tax=Rhynchophorus ferrugineus TaxID=354439 RepID=A0A834I8G9_RHYFE|nr:hypothetical protein GWI33_012283 [Rhynchophorus ferrugineus]
MSITQSHNSKLPSDNFSISSKTDRNEGENDKDLTLEKVARDMAIVLINLKNGIKLVKSTAPLKGSEEVTDDVGIEIEKLYEKHKSPDAAKSPGNKVSTTNKTNPPTNSNHSNRVTQNSTNKVNQNQKRSGAQKRRPSVIDSKKTNNNKTNAQTIGGAKKLYNRTSISNAAAKKTLSGFASRAAYNPLGIIKDEVEKAKREKKTFTIHGQYPAIRRALLKRGWVEKFHPSFKEKMNQNIRRFYTMDVAELVDLLRNRELTESIKVLIKSKLLKDHQVDLYWDHSFDAFKECPDSKKLTMINRFRRDSYSYTSKEGLCYASRDSYWLQIPGVARINHPRCYVLCKGGDTQHFVRDFGITAAISLLKWLVKTNITGETKVVSYTGQIPLKYFYFAITECYKFIKRLKHQDIDEDIKEAMEVEWNEFLQQFYKTVHVGNHFKLDAKENPVKVAKSMIRKANYILNEIRPHIPCFDMDGYMNIWILKPINSSRGIGIHVCRTLQYILDVIKKNPNRRYVIQKYIERPLLIHDTKFDIRQWFLVTSSHPLTIWMYKSCYLRFSSQTFNLRILHESIHLTNNSIQSKYKQQSSRDPLLPSHGMWDSKEFKKYLSNIGYPKIFQQVIYPGMKECITGAMIAHRDKIDKRRNCFEIYGADFMLTETFEPWLLEINSNPALFASTPVTAKMCPEVLEDVIKVVVDNARNSNAGTGNFELIYKENLQNQTANIKAQFDVSIIPVSQEYFCDISEKQSPRDRDQTLENLDPSMVLLKTGENMKTTLRNLIGIIRNEKLRKRCRKEQSVYAKNLTATDSSTQTRQELIALYRSPISEMLSGYSQDILNNKEQGYPS